MNLIFFLNCILCDNFQIYFYSFDFNKLITIDLSKLIKLSLNNLFF